MLSRRALLGAALALVVLSALAGCASAEKEKKVQQLRARAAYEQGLRNLADGRVGLGMAAIREAIQLDPENAVYRNALGVVHLDMRRPAEAQKEFEAAIEIDPNYAEAYHNLGLAHAEQSRMEEAVASYRKALTFPTYPTPQVAYHNIGNAYFYGGKLKEAEEAFRAAIQLEPRQVSSYYGLGLVLSKAGRKEDAKAAFRAARDIDPQSPFGQAAVEALKTLGEGG